MKKQDCKHKLHFMEKEFYGGTTIYEETHLGVIPIGHKPIVKILAVFVCEKCGEVKRVEIKQKGGKNKNEDIN